MQVTLERAADTGSLRLDAEALAAEADSTVKQIERLDAIDAIRRGPDGRFGRGDVIRSHLLAAYEAGGVSLGATGFVFTPRGEVALKGIGAPVALIEVHRA